MSDDFTNMPPAFSFDRCPTCHKSKNILEAMYLDQCEFCEIDSWLKVRREDLYKTFGLK